MLMWNKQNKVTVKVDTRNYVGETTAELVVVNSVKIVFYNGDSIATSTYVGEGMYLPSLPLVSQAGKTFECWCSDSAGTKVYDVSRPVAAKDAVALVGDEKGATMLIELFARFKAND